jgi:hypothetical protein
LQLDSTVAFLFNVVLHHALALDGALATRLPSSSTSSGGTPLLRHLLNAVTPIDIL